METTTSRCRTQVEPLEPRTLFTIAFGTPVSVPFAYVDGLDQVPVFCDFNNDTKLDVLIPVASTTQGGPAGTLFYAQGNGDGTFKTPAPVATAVFNTVAAEGDFNGDGNCDFAVTDFGAGMVHAFTGNGDGTFSSAIDFAAGQGAFKVGSADFNHDGRDDLVAANRMDDTLTVRLGDATSVLGAANTIPVGDDPSGFVIGDFNGDQALDILSGNTATGNSSLSAVAGNGDGTFDTPVTTAGPGEVVDVGDFNNDGKLDLLRGFDNSLAPGLSLGNGDFTFAAAIVPGPYNIGTVGDVDADGNDDVIFAGSTDQGFAVVLAGKGDGTFDTNAIGVTFASTGGLGAAGDLNGDGRLDLAFVGYPTNTSIALNSVVSIPSGQNLAAAIIGPALPASVVGGAKGGNLSVRVTNAGNATVTSPITVRLLASADGVLDGADTEIVRTTSAGSIKAGKSKTVKFKFNYPAGVAAGAYSILAQIDPDNALAGEAPKTDNVAVSPTQVTIAPPFIDLAATLPTPITAPFKLGKKGKLTLVLQNLGNVIAKGTAAATVTFSTDASKDDADAATVANAKVNLKPNTLKRSKLSFTLPPALTASSYRLFIDVVATDFTDVSTANNSVLAAETVTVE